MNLLYSLRMRTIVLAFFLPGLPMLAPKAEGVGTLDGFNPNADQYVESAVVQPDGRIHLIGAFSMIGGVSRQYHARLLSGGGVDSTFNVTPSSAVEGLASGPDDLLYFYGAFTNIAGVNRKFIARTSQSGSLETNPNHAFTSRIYSLGFLRQGDFWVGGGFSAQSTRLWRFSSTGEFDPTFAPTFLTTASYIVPAGRDRFYVGGTYESGSQTRTRVVLVSSDGTVDPSFIEPSSSTVPSINVIALQADGKLLVGGNSILVRFLPNGALDSSFNPSPNNSVVSIAIQTDGKLLVGGSFTTIAGVSQANLARLNPDGSLDTSFAPTVNNSVSGITLMDTGHVILTGSFTRIWGVTRNRVGRVDNDPVSQSITVPNAGRIQWLRSGAMPEPSSVVFDLSTDGGSTWSRLGFGSRIAGGWELQSLVLPSSGSLRCRALVPCGALNASTSQYSYDVPFTGLAPVAEIAVEQPAGTNLVDGESTVDFGAVDLPATATRTFRIKNIGNAELTGLSAAFLGTHAADFTVQNTIPTSLAAGTSIDVEVRFASPVFGTKTASLQIQSSDADEAVFDINLTGLANEAEIDVTQQTGNVNLVDGSGTVALEATPAGTHVSQSFSISNTGNIEMTGVVATLSGTDVGDYAVTTAPATSIAPGGSTTLTVRFAPGVVGTRVAQLQIASNDLDENPFDIALSSQSTNPDADGDNDGLSDAKEFWLGTNSTLADTDGDGANDGLEWRSGSNALVGDTDVDGIPDAYEIAHGLTPWRNDTAGDADFDGVTNLQEFNAGTLASLIDSDSDGISDVREVLGRGFTRNWYDKNNRLLGQGFDNAVWLTQDYDANSNPIRQRLQKRSSHDQDGDRLPDFWELENGFDPNMPNGNGDADNDGATNVEEYVQGTDPKSANSKTTNDGTVIAISSAFPWTPTNYVMGTGQLDGTGIEEVIISGDGNPGGVTNVLKIFTPDATGTTWMEETVPVGTVGVTSICVGHTSAANTIFIGTRAMAPAFGQIIKFVKTAGVWTPTVVVTSTDQVAFVAGYVDTNPDKLIGQFSYSVYNQRICSIDPNTFVSGPLFSDSGAAADLVPRFVRDRNQGTNIIRFEDMGSSNVRVRWHMYGGLGSASYTGPQLNATTAFTPNLVPSPGLTGNRREGWRPSAFQFRVNDTNGSGTVDTDDIVQMVEMRYSNTVMTQRSVPTFAPTSGQVATGVVYPYSNTQDSVLLTGDPDGIVHLWTPGATPYSALDRRLLSGAHRGKQWHEFRSLRGLDLGDGVVALALAPDAPAAPQLVVWRALALAENANAVAVQTSPQARIASTSSAGGPQSLVDVDLWDAEANPSLMAMQYRLNAWSTWSNATILTVDDASATAFIVATPTGTRHRLLWNAAADLGNGFAGNVLLRVRATDAADVGSWSEQVYFRVAATPEIAVRDLSSSLDLTDSGASINLGEITVGRPITRSFRISNEGNAALDGIALTGNASAGAGMSLPALTSSVSGGSSQEFTATFTPTTAGAHSATLQIASTDADESPFEIPLSFTAVQHIITVAVTPTSVSEDGGNTLTYTFSRSSSADVLSVGYTLDGTATAGVDYAVSPANAVTFAQGSTTAQLVVTPTSDGDQEPDETVIVSVLGGQTEFIAGTPVSATGGILADELPTVVTALPGSITPSSAGVGGQVTVSGTNVTERGVLYSTNPVVTIVSGTKLLLGSGTGSYSTTLANLSQATTYYVRAYAINSAGTGYGNTLNFTTTTVPNGPGWTSPTGLENSMTIYAQVDREGSKIESTGSRLAAFQSNAVAGVAAPITGPGGIKLYQMTVWSNSTSATLPMKVYDAGSDEVLDIQETLAFTANGVLGTIAAPVLLHVRPPTVDQVIPLVQGMNWISFNALPASHTVSSVLSQHTPQDNDLIKGTQGTATYFGGTWYPTSGFTLEPGWMYILRRQAAGSANLTVTGEPVDTTASIPLVAGWNWLGYNPQAPRQISQALAGLSPSNNDLIKGQYNGSATFFDGEWYASSYELSPGRGYLIKLTTAQSFAYDTSPSAMPSPGPIANEGEDLTPFPGGEAEESEAPAAAPPNWQAPSGKENSMTIYAVVEIGGQRVEALDAQLAILEGGQVAGSATIMQGPTGKLYQLTAWSDANSNPIMTLKAYDPAISIVRDLVPTITFAANGVEGGIASPMVFSAPALTPIEVWRHTHFGTISNSSIAADTSDDDGDGIANLLEYATSMAPKAHDHLPISCSKPGPDIEFVYTRNTQATDVTMTVEWSDTLGDDWSSAGITTSIISDTGTVQQVKALIPAGGARRFVHLKITRP